MVAGDPGIGCPERAGRTPPRRHPFAAVNLISNPIHGYLELTKRLTPVETRAAGLLDEDVAEEDLLDTAWLQRLRRVGQGQSARWVFPTAEHSRFTHGLGVMHEAGLWARTLYPSLAASLRAGGDRVPTEGLVVETLRVAGLLHDVATGRSPTSSTSTCWPPSPPRSTLGERVPRRSPTRTSASSSSSASWARSSAGLRRAPGAVAERDRFADGEAIKPRWVAFLISKPALDDASMPRWVRWLQPLLSACSRPTTSTTSDGTPT